MTDVFVSYKREDRAWTAALTRSLQQRGFTVWWDNRIECGQGWIATIKRALDASKAVIVVWSPRSVANDRTYLSEIMESEAQEGLRRNALLPVRIESAHFAFGHDMRNATNLTDWNGSIDDSQFVQLCERLVAFSGERTLPDDAELAAWLKAEDANNAGAIREFARSYPRSRFAQAAESRAALLDQVAADIELVRDAAIEMIAQFATEVGKPKFAPLPTFSIDQKSGDLRTSQELFDRLAKGEKVVLHAEPGGGKTVTLLEWAGGYCKSGPERIGVFLRLKEVANTNEDLIDHVARLESQGIVAHDAWKALTRSGVLTFFCDGWNELNDDERQRVGAILDSHARSFPSAGLVIGSRPLAPPPLTRKHALLQLHRLSIDQVRAIIEVRVGDAAPRALAELRQSRALRELVRTPFFLTAFCETRTAGSTPTTREGLIHGMIVALEQAPQHAIPLRQILNLQQAKYLASLAVEMIERQHAQLDHDTASRIVNQTSALLFEQGLVTRRPDAGVVLATLRDHHCLIEHIAELPSYRFQHQLIDEWYAAAEVISVAISALTDETSRRRLDREILNQLSWSEAILFAVQTPHISEEHDVAISRLILRTIGIDLEFAGDLIAAAPPEIWRRIATTVKHFVDNWDAAEKDRRLQFILHCGKPEFATYVWDAISAERSGSVPQALQTSELLHPAVLGLEWQAKCATLDSKVRSSLFAMLASSDLQGAAMAVEAAIADPDSEMRAEVAEALYFHGFREELTELLGAASPRDWDELARRRHIEPIWEDPWRQSAIAAAHRILDALPSGTARLQYALWLKSKGEDLEFDFVAELLAAKFEYHQGEDEMLARVAAIDGDRLSAMIVERALRGEHVLYRASRYIKEGTIVDQDRLIALCRAQKHNSGHLELLAQLLTKAGVATLLDEIHTLRAQVRAASGNERTTIAEEFYRVQQTLSNADKNILAEAVLADKLSDSAHIADLSELIMRAYRSDTRRDGRAPLHPELRARLVECLAAWSVIVIADKECDRYVLDSVAEAIGTLPSETLLEPMRALLAEDLRRWRLERERYLAERARGRLDPASGSRTSYAVRYAANLLSLAKGQNGEGTEHENPEEKPIVSEQMTEAVIATISAFYSDSDFGPEAAHVVAALRPDPLLEIGVPRRFGSLDLRVVAERRRARAARPVNVTETEAARLLDVIEALAAENLTASTQQAVRLALHASRMDCGPRLTWLAAFVFREGGIEARLKFMTNLLLLGHNIDANVAVAEKCLDDLDARRLERRWEFEQGWYRWQELLILMIFGGKPIEAAKRLLTYDFHGQNHNERDILEALALCGHPDALTALNLLKERSDRQHILDAWCNAVHGVGTAEAGALLLEHLLGWESRTERHDYYSLSKLIAQLAEAHASVATQLLDAAVKCEPTRLGRISSVVRHLEDEDLVAKFLSLPGDRLLALSPAIAEALRQLCIEHRPSEEVRGAFEIIPRSVASLRAKLFAKITEDDGGGVASIRLLQVIDQIREDYGDATDEARHPDIAAGKPWPLSAQVAWEAADSLSQANQATRR